MTKLLAALALLAFAGISQAQTTATPCNAAQPYNAVCLTWIAPTALTDETPITQPLTYRVEQRAGAGAWATVESTPMTRSYITGLAVGTYSFRVFVNCAGCTESDASNTAAKTIAVPPKPKPAILTLVVTIALDSPPKVLRTVATVKP